MKTLFVISDASILYSHKVIFPVDNNSNKFGNIYSKMKREAAFEYIWCYSNSSSEKNIE